MSSGEHGASPHVTPRSIKSSSVTDVRSARSFSSTTRSRGIRISNLNSRSIASPSNSVRISRTCASSVRISPGGVDADGDITRSNRSIVSPRGRITCVITLARKSVIVRIDPSGILRSGSDRTTKMKCATCRKLYDGPARKSALRESPYANLDGGVSALSDETLFKRSRHAELNIGVLAALTTIGAMALTANDANRAGTLVEGAFLAAVAEWTLMVAARRGDPKAVDVVMAVYGGQTIAMLVLVNAAERKGNTGLTNPLGVGVPILVIIALWQSRSVLHELKKRNLWSTAFPTPFPTATLCRVGAALLVVGAVLFDLGLMMRASAGDVAAAPPEPPALVWKPYVADKSAFTAEFPGSPSRAVDRHVVEDMTIVRTRHTLVLRSPDIGFVVVVLEYPEGVDLVPTAEDAFATSRDQILKGTKGLRLVSSKSARFGNFPSCDVDYALDQTPPTRMLHRIIVTPRAIYQLISSYSNSAGEPLARRFIDSFTWSRK